MNIYEMHGRLQEQYDREVATHRNTIRVLHELKSGALRPDQIDVDIDTFSWSVHTERNHGGEGCKVEAASADEVDAMSRCDESRFGEDRQSPSAESAGEADSKPTPIPRGSVEG